MEKFTAIDNVVLSRMAPKDLSLYYLRPNGEIGAALKIASKANPPSNLSNFKRNMKPTFKPEDL